MRPTKLLRCVTLFLVICSMFIMLSGTGRTDPIGDEKTRPVTKAEREFIEKNGEAIKRLFPSPGEKWKVEGNIDKGSYSDSEVAEFRGNQPLNFSVRIDFHELTRAELKKAREKEVYQMTSEELKQKMMEALQRGDAEEAERLGQQMGALAAGEYTKSMGAAMDPTKTPSQLEKGREFYIQVMINSGGEHIGKEYEFPVQGVTKSFKIERKDHARYKYYIGNWDVSDYNPVNWSIWFPKKLKTQKNHLRLLSLFVEIDGEKKAVEQYVRDQFPLEGLRALIQ